MRNRTGLVVLVVAIIVAVGGLAWWWLRPQDEVGVDGAFSPAVSATVASQPVGSPAATTAAQSPTVGEIPSVRVAVASEATAARVARFTGNVLPQRDVTLVAKVPGTVQWVAGDMGDQVEAGAPVVRLDATELSLALAQSEAQLEAAEANLARVVAGATEEELAQARAAVQQAELAVERLGDVLSRQEQLFAQGVIPEETILSVRTEYEVARLQYETAKQQLQRVERGATEEERRAVRAQVQQAEVAVHLAEQQLADTVIRAPFSGLLAARPVQVGTLVGAGTPVAAIVDIEQVIIEAGVSEREINQLAVGQPVRVFVDALGGAQFAGVVDAVAPVADQQTRNFPVRFRVDNSEHLLKPGMIARVEVVLDDAPVGVAVPQAAVVQRGGRSVVYVLESTGSGVGVSGQHVVRERAVTVGTPTAGLVAVTGVSVGELVVLAPDTLRDGMIVHPIDLDGGAFTPAAGVGGV